MFFIDDGEVTLTKAKGASQIEKVGSGETFGLLSVLFDQGPKEKAVSNGFSSIYSISRADLISILKQNKKDYVTLI